MAKKRIFSIAAMITLVGAAVLFQNCSQFSVITQSVDSPKVPIAEEEPESTETPTLQRTDFMTGLNNPWDLAFAADGTMFFTERCRGLSVRLTSGAVQRLFGTAGSALVAPDFFCEGQTGMHGVAIDPNFSTNRAIYVYMSSNINTNPRSNRIVRLIVSADWMSVSNRTDIVTDMAYKNVGNDWGDAGSHSGGRIRFGPDGFLYVTTGDNHNGPLPQELTRLGGKVLRITTAGAAAPGNNTPSGGDPRIYTFGHRNVQGISFRPSTGQAYISEHGPNHSDEVTPLVAGRNGGWDPRPEAGVTCASNYCGYISNKTSGELTPMTDIAKYPDALPPIWRRPVSGGTGPCLFLNGTQWKGWNRRLLVGVMGGQSLELLQLNTAGELADATTVQVPAARYRSLVQGPDGALYIAIDAGAIWKVVAE